MRRPMPPSTATSPLSSISAKPAANCGNLLQCARSGDGCADRVWCHSKLPSDSIPRPPVSLEVYLPGTNLRVWPHTSLVETHGPQPHGTFLSPLKCLRVAEACSDFLIVERGGRPGSAKAHNLSAHTTMKNNYTPILTNLPYQDTFSIPSHPQHSRLPEWGVLTDAFGSSLFSSSWLQVEGAVFGVGRVEIRCFYGFWG